MAQRMQQHIFRIALQAGHIHIAGCLAIPLPAGGILVSALEDVKLEFRSNHWPHSEVRELRDHPLEHRSRTFRRRGAVWVVDVGDDVGNTLLPGHYSNGADVWESQYVWQAGFKSAFDVDNIAHWCRAVNRSTESHAVTHRAGEPVDENVSPTLGPDQIRVADAYHVDIL